MPYPSSLIILHYYHPHPPYLHSFPTRRSSDLRRQRGDLQHRQRRAAASAADRRAGSAHASLSCAAPEHVSRHEDRKSTRLNSSHLGISYAVFCLKKKKIKKLLTIILLYYLLNY